MLPVTHRGRARPTGIGPGFRLRQRPSANLLPLRQRCQILVLLLLIPKLKNVIAAQRIVSRHNNPHRPIHPRQLLNRDHILDVAEPSPAIFFRKNHTQQTHLRQLGHYLRRKVRSLIPLHHVRRNLALGKVPHTPPQLLLFLGKRKIHWVLGFPDDRQPKSITNPSFAYTFYTSGVFSNALSSAELLSFP